MTQRFLKVHGEELGIEGKYATGRPEFAARLEGEE